MGDNYFIGWNMHITPDIVATSAAIKCYEENFSKPSENKSTQISAQKQREITRCLQEAKAVLTWVRKKNPYLISLQL